MATPRGPRRQPQTWDCRECGATRQGSTRRFCGDCGAPKGGRPRPQPAPAPAPAPRPQPQVDPELRRALGELSRRLEQIERVQGQPAQQPQARQQAPTTPPTPQSVWEEDMELDGELFGLSGQVTARRHGEGPQYRVYDLQNRYIGMFNAETGAATPIKRPTPPAPTTPPTTPPAPTPTPTPSPTQAPGKSWFDDQMEEAWRVLTWLPGKPNPFKKP